MLYYGIDLGTTNSVIAFSQIKPNGQVSSTPIDIERVTNSGNGLNGAVSLTRDRRKTLPSCVYYAPEAVYVGDYARDQYKKYPGLVVRSVKSQMGNPGIEGYPDVPDRSPEAVSARILAHLKKAGEHATRNRITNVIITVPANFDTAMKEATMKAAELAGFPVRDESGEWKPLLISEPNAVLYDLAQRLINGEIAPTVLDLSQRKRVMVFDIGGGTLDVTVHEIERSGDGLRLHLSEIASSRYTKLAGDDFDRAITECLYQRLLAKLEENEPQAVSRIQSRQSMIKKLLLVAAEKLKIDMSVKVENKQFDATDSWFDDFETDENVEISHPIGDERIYNDSVSQEEFEAMVESFLGLGIEYDDYRNYSKNPAISRQTIVAPILDVLEKSARYYANLGEDDFKIDAVVLNGGMSKLYLIKDRLKEFFGFAPITSSDPDLSVANGAAVYACVLAQQMEAGEPCSNIIEIIRHIQNDDLYLGLYAGANDQLISEGTQLPHAAVIEGYHLQAGTSSVEIPIKRREPSGELRTIARGKITFRGERPYQTTLKIEADFDQTGLISIKAHLLGKNGQKLETGKTEIALGAAPGKASGTDRICPREGTVLNPANEICALKGLIESHGKDRNARIEDRVQAIVRCGNPEDFAEIILRQLVESNNYTFKYRLYTIIAQIGGAWSEPLRKRFVETARRDIVSEEFSYGTFPIRKKLSDYVRTLVASF